MSEPLFVVVGNVNRGKSSVVATLAADDSVQISPIPGTTRSCREFPLRVNGRTLYKLIDTPGFERPRQALAWMTQRAGGTVNRREAVEAFIREHATTGEYPQEVQLLRPILDGGAILYVVDGSKPFSPKYEAEMEVLRWTAQPRMALINPIEGEGHGDEWRRVLDQYFNIVRVFDAHQADFAARIALLEGLRELNVSWRGRIDEAIAALKDDRRRGLRESASIVAAMLVEMLTLRMERTIPAEQDPTPYKERLKEDYYDKLRTIERKSHESLKQVYSHQRLETDSVHLAAVDDDLISQVSLAQLGLRNAQLVATGAAAGALVGGVIDAGVGGASFMAGAVLGSVIGGTAAYYGSRGLPQVILPKWTPKGGPILKIGPMSNANFPWVVLDRALLFHRAVSQRAHARQDKAQVNSNETAGLVAAWSATRLAQFERQFQTLRSKLLPVALKPASETVRERLTDLLTEALVEMDVRKQPQAAITTKAPDESAPREQNDEREA